MNFTNSKTYIKVSDHSVSKESFDLLFNEEYQILQTSPQPSLEKLPSYYESEDYISHTDSKRTLFEKAYHLVKRNALNNKVNLITKLIPQKGIVLDIGSGTGDFLITAKSKGWKIVGLEPNPKAKKIAESKGVVFETSLETIPDNSMDVISMWHVLEHVPNLEAYISKLKSLLKPNGILVIAVPNYKSYDADYYKEFWAAFDVPRHLWHFSRKSIQKLFSKHQLKIDKMLPMKFDSFYVSLLSEKYKTGKSNFIKAFLVGLTSNVKANATKEFSSLIYVLKNG